MDFLQNLKWQLSQPGLKLAYNLDYDPRSVWQVPALENDDSTLPFYVQEVGLTIAGSDYYVYRENMASFLLAFTTSGSMTVEYDGVVTVSPAGTFGWYDCRKPMAYYVTPGIERAEAYFVHMYGSGIEQYTQRFRQLSDTGSIQIKDQAVISSCFKKLISLYAPGARTATTDLNACTLLSMLCMAVLDQAALPQNQAAPDYIAEITAFLEEHYRERIDLERLSREFFLSKSYIQRQFKAQVGQSPAEYLTQLRLDRAKALLRDKDMPIARIGEEVGIPDPSYFAYTFRRAEGISPLEYRKLMGRALKK